MAKPCSTHYAPVDDLVSALAQIGAQIDHQPLRSSALARIMRETFHGAVIRIGSLGPIHQYSSARARS